MGFIRCASLSFTVIDENSLFYICLVPYTYRVRSLQFALLRPAFEYRVSTWRVPEQDKDPSHHESQAHRSIYPHPQAAGNRPADHHGHGCARSEPSDQSCQHQKSKKGCAISFFATARGIKCSDPPGLDPYPTLSLSKPANDDFDVFDGDRDVGRIYRMNARAEIWFLGVSLRPERRLGGV
jgi:hypothetical protein